MNFDDLKDESAPVAATPTADNQPTTTTPDTGTPDFDALPDESSVSEQIKAGAEGAARGVLGPFATATERIFGVPAGNILARRQTFPKTEAATEVGGFGASLLSGEGIAPLLGKVGEIAQGAKTARAILEAKVAAQAAGKSAAEIAAAGSKAIGLGAKARIGAAEMAALQASDEVSRMMLQDPTQSIQTAIADVGLASVLGGAGGFTLGAGGQAFRKAMTGGNKFLTDFVGTLKSEAGNLDPVGGLTKELQDHWSKINSAVDETWGAQGIKARAIANALPEMSSKITEQAQGIRASLDKAIQSLGEDPLARQLQAEADKFTKAIQGTPSESILGGPNTPASVGDVFDATQSLKQKLQEWSKFNVHNLPPIAERNFIKTATSLGHEVRVALEDPAVWGDAAKLQAGINSRASKLFPSLKQFGAKFTDLVGTERQINPQKVSTYLNQLGKPNAEIKQAILKNFLNDSEAFEGAYNKLHTSLGAEPPIAPSALTASRDSLNEVTPGMKLARALVKKGVDNLGAEALGTSIGAAAGKITHIPGAGLVGGLIGQHALSPFFRTILPILTKPLMEKLVNGVGFQAAGEYGASVITGAKLIQSLSQSLFKAGGVRALDSIEPSKEDIEKLDKRLLHLNREPAAMLDISGHLGHYLPGHAGAMGQAAAQTVQYLNAQRPQEKTGLAFDTPLKPNDVQNAQWNRTLKIAQQPLYALKLLSAGRLNHTDLQTLNTLYPALYSQMKQKVMGAMIEAKDAGTKVPYAKRTNLSLFLGEPLDSTMTPQSIQAIQATFAMAAPASQQPAAGRQRGQPSKLSGLPKLSMTDDQAREVNRQKS